MEKKGEGMKLKKVLAGVVLVSFLASLPLLLAGPAHAEDQAVNQTEISNKLDQILASQKAIMNEIAAMKQELSIIKVRVTQAQ